MSCLDALDVIPHRAVPNPQLLANLMNRDLLPIEVRDTPLDAERNRSTGYALALSASPRHARLDSLANQGALKLGERGQDREDRLPLRSRRVDVFLIGDKIHPQAMELVQGLHQRLGGSGKAIVPPDQHHIDVALPGRR